MDLKNSWSDRDTHKRSRLGRSSPPNEAAQPDRSRAEEEPPNQGRGRRVLRMPTSLAFIHHTSTTSTSSTKSSDTGSKFRTGSAFVCCRHTHACCKFTNQTNYFVKQGTGIPACAGCVPDNESILSFLPSCHVTIVEIADASLLCGQPLSK